MSDRQERERIREAVEHGEMSIEDAVKAWPKGDKATSIVEQAARLVRSKQK